MQWGPWYLRLSDFIVKHGMSVRWTLSQFVRFGSFVKLLEVD